MSGRWFQFQLWVQVGRTDARRGTTNQERQKDEGQMWRKEERSLLSPPALSSVKAIVLELLGSGWGGTPGTPM